MADALGIYYELLVGTRPFSGATRSDLADEIEYRDPRPPRQVDPAIPKELTRIYLTCLEKRASDRYEATTDLIDDLRHWVATHDAAQEVSTTATRPQKMAKRIVPKGLRCFDADDADFFLDLLPGPRDRDGLPKSIRFRKTHIEETDADKTFSVGLVYGPSGCGKSSLIRADLLPRLAGHVLPIYLEATVNETESRLRSQLSRSSPNLPSDGPLREWITAIRESRSNIDQKVVIIIDQFEQWLHAHRNEFDVEMLHALRQCDGSLVQAVVTVRDDFAMAVARFMKANDISILEGHNFATVDLFDVDHAEKVLTRFGQAYGRLPDKPADVSHTQRQFLNDVAAGLAQDGRSYRCVWPCLRR